MQKIVLNKRKQIIFQAGDSVLAYVPAAYKTRTVGMYSGIWIEKFLQVNVCFK